jgi:hypothetical protein
MPDFDPLPTLRKVYPYPISLLALLADYRGAISGGQSLEVFVPGHGIGPNSDFDVYLPRNPDAIMDAMHLLRIAGITWKNYISEMFNDIHEYNCAIVPFQMLCCMARDLRIHPKNLDAYVKGRFGSDKNCTKFASSFASGLEWAYKLEKTYQKRYGRSYKPRKDMLWKYNKQDETSTLVLLCGTFERLMHYLLDLLEPLGKRECRNQIKLHKIKWKKLGLPETFFWRHLLRRLRMFHIQETEGYTMKEARIQYIVDNFFPENDSKNRPEKIKKKQKRKNRKTKEPALIYPGFDFQMLRGTLQDGTGVQLMLLPPDESILHYVLKFYATNIMSFVGGMFAAHLYYDSATTKHISYKLDISEDKYKHKHSLKGISKYKKRGWKFKKFTKGRDPNLRHGSDNKVKMVDYEDIYRSALQSQHGDTQEISKNVEDYFRERKSAFRVSNWVEREGKIDCINYVDYEGKKGSDHRPAGVLDWVHDTLEGHKDVTPKAVWEEREKIQFVLLDLWFGGAGALAIHTRYLLQDTSWEEFNLPDSDPESDSDATFVEDSALE